MAEMTRRRILAAIPGTCVVALSSAPDAAADEAPAAPKTEMFAVGPFLLGEWIPPKVGKPLFGDLTGASPPEFEEIVKSLNECRLFVVDGRTINDPKSPSFSRKQFGELSAAGKMVHIWKSFGSEFSIVVSKLELGVTSLREMNSPATKKVIASLELNIHTSVFIGQCESKYSLAKNLTYDVFGRIVKGPT
jgi:hypothetical protein